MTRRESLQFLLGAAGGAWLSPGRAAEASQAGAVPPAFTWLKAGEVKPAGWIKEQMVRDLNQGFAGRLDELCAEASSDRLDRRRIGGRPALRRRKAGGHAARIAA